MVTEGALGASETFFVDGVAVAKAERVERNVRLTVRVPPETEAWLMETAAASHMRPSAFLSAALVVGAKQFEVLMHVGRIVMDQNVQDAFEKAAGGIPGIMENP